MYHVTVVRYSKSILNNQIDKTTDEDTKSISQPWMIWKIDDIRTYMVFHNYRYHVIAENCAGWSSIQSFCIKIMKTAIIILMAYIENSWK